MGGDGMPFEQVFPRSFTAASVKAYAPASSGLYGITNAAEWIFIGEAENIREALLGHLGEGNTELTRRGPTGFVYEECGRAGRGGRQDRLVREYDPACNRRWTRHGRTDG